MIDSFKHKGMRRRLVEVLRSKDIQSEEVLAAVGRVPRHMFLDSSFEDHAYQNKAFPIGEDQTISHPYTVAFQTELLHLNGGEKVLEIGTGSGYQTAVLLEMGTKVFSIERQNGLFHRTKSLLPKMGYIAKLKYGDGYIGWEEFAPYDRIIVTAGAPFIPDALKSQLKIGGILVIPVGREKQVMTVLVKKSESDFETFTYDAFQFVPMLEDKARR